VITCNNTVVAERSIILNRNRAELFLAVLMSEPAPEKEQVGSEAWEAKRQREIRELREKEREKAAEHKQKKEAGLLPDTPALSKQVAAASKVRASYERDKLIGTVIKIVGVLLLILGTLIGFNEVMYMVTGHGFLPFLTP